MRKPSAAPPRDRLRNWMPGKVPLCSCRCLAKSESLAKRIESAAIDPVPEALLPASLHPECLEQRTEKRGDFLERDVGGVQAVDACARRITPQHRVVVCDGRAGQGAPAPG